MCLKGTRLKGEVLGYLDTLQHPNLGHRGRGQESRALGFRALGL